MFVLLPFLYPSIGVELMDESLSFPAAKFLKEMPFFTKGEYMLLIMKYQILSSADRMRGEPGEAGGV